MADSLLTWAAEALTAHEANIAPVGQVDIGTVEFLYRAYDDTTEEYANGVFQVPPDIDTSGTVTFYAACTPDTAAASTNCGWTFGHRALAHDEAIDGAYTEEDSGAKALSATDNDLNILTWTETVSNLGWAANDTVIFRLSRDPSVASDLTGDLWLIQFSIRIPLA